MVNLTVNEYYMGTLKIVNNRIIIEKSSESVRKKEDPIPTKDAEQKHRIIPLMNNANSREHIQLEEARNIAGERIQKFKQGNC